MASFKIEIHLKWFGFFSSFPGVCCREIPSNRQRCSVPVAECVQRNPERPHQAERFHQSRPGWAPAGPPQLPSSLGSHAGSLGEQATFVSLSSLLWRIGRPLWGSLFCRDPHFTLFESVEEAEERCVAPPFHFMAKIAVLSLARAACDAGHLRFFWISHQAP